MDREDRSLIILMTLLILGVLIFASPECGVRVHIESTPSEEVYG